MEPRCYQCNTLLGDINAACPNCLPNWNRAYAPEVPQPDAPVSWEEQRYLDAQATIAALQARVKELEEWKRIVTGAGTDQESVIRLAAHEYTKIAVQCWKEANAKLESQLTQRTAECDALKLVNDTHMKTVMKLSHVVEQRTAELEAAKRQIGEEQKRLLVVCDQRNDARAELERVRGERDDMQRAAQGMSNDLTGIGQKYDELRTLILALPKVEGEITVSVDPDSWYVMPLLIRCVTKEQADGIAALLQHRQGMEG